jgi:hypothetical protein
MILNIMSTTDFAVEIGLFGMLLYGLTNSALTILFVTPFRRHAADTFIYWWLLPILKYLNLYNPDQVQEITVRTTRNE